MASSLFCHTSFAVRSSDRCAAHRSLLSAATVPMRFVDATDVTAIAVCNDMFLNLLTRRLVKISLYVERGT